MAETPEPTPAPQPADDQPKSGLMWMCRGCQAALVARGVEGSGYCRECFELLPPELEGPTP